MSLSIVVFFFVRTLRKIFNLEFYCAFLPADFHRCNKALSAKDQDVSPCDWYQRVYKSLCPMSWVSCVPCDFDSVVLCQQQTTCKPICSLHLNFRLDSMFDVPKTWMSLTGAVGLANNWSFSPCYFPTGCQMGRAGRERVFSREDLKSPDCCWPGQSTTWYSVTRRYYPLTNSSDVHISIKSDVINNINTHNFLPDLSRWKVTCPVSFVSLTLVN